MISRLYWGGYGRALQGIKRLHRRTDYFYVDNVAIKTNELSVSVTKDNIPGATYPDLKSGVPPTLVRQDDGFALAAGENMTITYRVTVKTPVNETRIVNTATATSYEKAPPASSTTIDPVSARRDRSAI